MRNLVEARYVDQADEVPDQDWEHYDLWVRVRETLFALPSYFRMEGNLPNIPARDLHSANTLLGAAIEDHIPVALNLLRSTWDPNSQYADCLFRRQPQTFPDVLLRRETTDGFETLFGIEVKSWYILAGENEPSFRLDVNRDFCAPSDLVAIYPWSLSAAISGTPRLFRPLVTSARKAARVRNEAWVAKGRNEAWQAITTPDQEPVRYPTKSDRINDHAPTDTGNNFGRVARSGVWDRAIATLLADETIAGIPLRGWQAFLSAFKEGTSLDDAIAAVRRIHRKLALPAEQPVAPALMKAAEALNELADRYETPPGTVNDRRRRAAAPDGAEEA